MHIAKGIPLQPGAVVYIMGTFKLKILQDNINPTILSIALFIDHI